MTAVVIHQAGGPETLQIQEWPEPIPSIGQVLIRVKAFGLNHSEIFTRQQVLYSTLSTVAFHPSFIPFEGISLRQGLSSRHDCL